MPKHSSLRSILFVVIGSAFIAATTVLAKIAQSAIFGEPLNPLQVSNGRFLFAFLSMCLVVAVVRPKFTKPNFPLHGIRTLCGYSAISLLFTAAAIIPVSDATAISFLNPVFAMFFAVPILKEKIGYIRWVAALIGLTGSMILIRPTGDAFEPAALLALLAAVVTGMEFILIKILAGKEKFIQILLINSFIGTCLSAVALIFVWQTPSMMQWMILAAIGSLMLIGQACNLLALKGADASFVLPFAYSTLIFVSIYDFAVFSVIPDLISFLGSAVIILGVMILTVQEIIKLKKTDNIFK